MKIIFTVQPAPEPLEPPTGWDNCIEGFCQGDWLIRSVNASWKIHHPTIVIDNVFTDPDAAVNFIKIFRG